MPNYKSKMLTFLSVGEMTSLALDSTDEDGLLFAVATGPITFKIVMWRKGSFATVDNETVYPANGIGRWHVLATGNTVSGSVKEVLTTVGDSYPDNISEDIELFVQKKTSGEKILKGRFNGIFEDLSFDDVILYNNNLGAMTPPPGIKMAVVKKTDKDEIYIAKNNAWELLNIAGSIGTIAFNQITGVASFSQLPTGTTASTVAIGNHSHLLSYLTDVTISGPSNGQVLKYNGSKWVNSTISTGNTPINLDALTDVTISSPNSGNVLKYDGTQWVNDTIGTGSSPTNLDALADVTIDNPTSNQVLKYNGLQWVNDTVVSTSAPTTLSSLTDVTVSNPANEQVLKYNGSRWVNSTINATNQPISFDNLTDVVISNPSTNQTVVYNGTQWVNQSSPMPSLGLNNLTDVTITSPVANQSVIYNGTRWVNQTIQTGGTGGASNLDALTDVTITSPNPGQSLVYNGSQWVNQTVSGGGGGGGIPPYINTINPVTLTPNKATNITISGTYFTPSTSVNIPDVVINSITVSSPTSLITNVTASEIEGVKPVTIANGSLFNTEWVGNNKTISIVSISDPYHDFVSLLIKGDGTNNSIDIFDESPSPKTVTRVGDTKISTSQSKYGGSSIYFDGAGDLLQIHNSPSFDFGVNNFTIEFWIFPLSSNYFLGKGDAASAPGSMLSFSPSYGCTAYFNGGSSVASAIILTLNQWQHIAIVRNTTNYTIFKDGVIHSSANLPVGATLNTVANPLQFGGYASQFINAYFDSIRITNEARYTSSFNPETDTYLN